ncbi:MAG: hypothetical protein L0H96_08855 [Humibacillus sp.]|nr:hypothetical protein [Humibacillus sp.]MDN5777005.1 hypothetical protein [Humibacillus sp.]
MSEAAPGPVPVVGEWKGARRFATGEPSSSTDDGAHGVVIPLRRAAWYSVPLLAIVGMALVGGFVAAVVAVVTGQARPWAWLGLIPLLLFGALGVFFLGAIPSMLKAMQPGRRWLLTPDALVTTNLTVRWDDIDTVRRSSALYPSRFRSHSSHYLGVTLRDDAEVKEIAESRFAAALTAKFPPHGLTLCDANTLGVDPERVAAAIALFASRPDLRPLLAEPAGLRLVSDPEAAR